VTIWEELDAAGSVLYNDGRTWECDREDVEGLLRAYQLDDRYPFSLWEVCYVNGSTAPGKVFVPAGGALAAKLDTIVTVVGPWRLRRGVSFRILPGGGYDPIWDSSGKRVTHRSSSTSHHQYRPDLWLDSPGKAGGTALDVQPKGDAQPNEDDIAWLKALDRKVSIIVYYPPDRGNFIHVDLRNGTPYRKRQLPKSVA
jgi:hypothetical protein